MLVIVTSHPIQYQAPLWRALAATGVKFEVWFLTPHAVQPSYDREFGRTFAWDTDLLSGYPHRFLPVQAGWRLNRFNGVKLEQGWSSLLREHNVTHLWVEGWRFTTLWAAVFAAHRAGAAIWLRGESHDLQPERGLRRVLKQVLLARLFNRIDRFLCIGTANRRFYRSHGIADAKLVSAPYCIDQENFRRRAEELLPQRPELRRRWNVPEDAWCVLFCGKFISKKRPLDLVAAARLARLPAGRRLHLLFVGDGALRPELLAALGVPGATPATLVGFLNQTEISQAFVAADCLVLPSDYGETWGLVVNEALAAGLPTIVSNRCGCAVDLAQPQGPNHVYPCGDIPALAGCIVAVALQPPLPALLQQLSESHSPARTAETVTRLLSGADTTRCHP
jgi:glycosyltransferase involved in cell wall biosynthesis